LVVERDVLAGMLLDPDDGIPRARALLGPEAFHLDRHALVFKALCALADRGEVADLLTLTAQLERTGDLGAAGGHVALAHILEGATTAANLAQHAALVPEAYARRRLRRLALHVQARVADPTTDAKEVVACVSRECAAVRVVLARSEAARHVR